METSKIGTAKEKTPKGPVRVFIVGGGCAGLAAAWQLQKRNYPPKYEIHVFEASWRLGGKGASGRDGMGRIHEHGLHVWLGFYENAFAMMRECYQQARASRMGPGAKDAEKKLPHASIDEAFFPEQHIGVASKNRAGRWEAWTGYLPPMEGLPGTGIRQGDNPFTLAGYLARAIALTRALIISVIAEPAKEPRPGEVRPDGAAGVDEAIELGLDGDPLRSPSGMIERITTALRNAAFIASALLLQCVTIVEVWLREFDPGQQWNSRVLDFLEALAVATRRRLAEIANIDEHIRRKTEIIELVITVVVGLYREKVLFSKEGLDSINGIDCRRWLLNHGATRTSVDSPFITGLYDLAFCYENGDRTKPALAAGQALRGVLRMFFTYRGSLFWSMRSGMGDTVFAPLYRVLKQKKVNFHFRHALTGIRFNGDLAEKNPANRVEALRFDRLVDADGSDRRWTSDDALDATGCWPQADPVAADADRGQKWEKGHKDYGQEDFDAVILAMGVDDFADVCGRPWPEKGYSANTLFNALPRWAEMREAVKTVATRSAQMWLNVGTNGLGWKRQPVIISGLEPPFETWADMTHTLAAEYAWRQAQDPVGGNDGIVDRSVHYFCGVLRESEVKAARQYVEKKFPDESKDAQDHKVNERLKKGLEEMIEEKLSAFWPSAKGRLKNFLTDFHAQANFSGSQRFTLSLPGTLEKRISPLDRSIANMTIAGDWTACGFEESCVEAAVMSGMLAAHAIAGYPALEDIVGYDHP